jgi:tetratricopeptide (TPR) repeat protein
LAGGRRILLAGLLGAILATHGQRLTGQAGSQSALSQTDLETMQAATEAMRGNRVEEAIAGFQKVTQDAPRFAPGYLNLGLAYAGVSRNQEAVVALQKAIALKPSLRGAQLFLAISLYKLNQLQPAAAAIRKETALDPRDAQAWMWQGVIDLALNRLTAAVEELDHAATLDPKNVDILYHRGHAALALSRQSYEDMFHLDPHSWHVHQVLAQADVESDRDADAATQYQLAIDSAPPQSGLYEGLGSALWRTGKFEEAEKAFEQALAIDPGDTLAMYKLGCLRVDRGDAAGGKPLLDRVAVADPTLELVAYYQGRAEAELGQDAAAVEHFKQVVAKNIDSETTKQAYFQLSRSYRHLHDDAAAAAAQAEYRKIDQQDKESLQERMQQRQQRADRDTRIPAPTQSQSSEP